MAIEINDAGNYVSLPIIKHQRIGESCKVAVIRWEQRDRLKDDPITKQKVKIPNGLDRNGQPKFKQELVIQAVAISGDMVASIGDRSSVPVPGDRVRLILKGKAFGDWIDARKKHRNNRFNVGDVLSFDTTHAQAWNSDASPKGPKILTQADADAVPRGTSIGFYGTLALVPGQEAAWIEAAETAYREDENAERQKRAIPLADATSDDYLDEFAAGGEELGI
jgi:hypothetical protein